MEQYGRRTGQGVEAQARTGREDGIVVGVDEEAAEGDGGVAAHGGVSVVVAKEHAHVGLAGADQFRLGPQDGTVHIPVAAGLQQHAAPDVVKLRLGLGALLEQRSAGQQRWETGIEDARRFACDVHVDTFQHGISRRQLEVID
jgi:hypothetical protein